ncbi:MAG: DUF4097 domain-containing protein [Vicinamibacterales bacterium]
MNTSTVTRFTAVVLLAASTPAIAAVTQRDARAADGRTAWYERYVEARQGGQQTDRVSETFRVGDGGALDLENLSGDVEVTGGDGQDIRVEAVKRVRARGGDADRLLEALRVDIRRVGDRIEVRTQYPRSTGRDVSASVAYTVTVPSGASVAVKTVSGDVRVLRVAGEVRAESVSGNVEVTGTPNLATAKSVSGNVTARDIGSRTTLSLGSVSGDVVARNLKVRTLEAGSVSGDLDLVDLEVERLEAKSVSGNVEFTGALARGGRYELSSHSGDIRLHLASDTGFELDANSFSGSIRSDLPITMRSDGGRGRRSRSNQSIRGSYGDASAILSVRSFSGSVVIARR